MVRPSRPPTDSPLELWGGIECTVNRVGDEFRDQLAESGHAARPADLHRFAELGLRTLRYPVLWEHAQPAFDAPFDWQWADERLPLLRELEIRPIVGLVHHGSGPRGTDLTSPSFVSGLTEYAQRLAERFPWVDDYTPVNEPLTTARFSGLYGHWYPHGRDPFTFQRALLIQCRAVAESMHAIRRINPRARLVQTDDLGHVASRPKLAYQARFENERRWLTWDLLCGKVDRYHPMYQYLRESGATEPELQWFIEHSCPADIIGINYYVTSDRYLDDRLSLYPPWRHGGNGRDSYADIEAVRAGAGPGMNLDRLLKAAAQRFRRPLAITECHLGCTREQQLRWLREVWETALSARASGIDVRAVTVWALLGLYDWNSLVTRKAGHYESGVFDLRSSQPRKTALARSIRELAAGKSIGHPTAQAPGWWRNPESATGSILLIVGAGTLGHAFARICDSRGLAYRLVSRAEVDIADASSIITAIAQYRPWAVINAAGYAQIDPAERDPVRCRRDNTTGAATVAAVCAEAGIPLVTFSSNHVFDGNQSRPYHEQDRVCPLNVYGESKAEAERHVLQVMPKALVIRAGEFFGPWDQHNFVRTVLRTLAHRQHVFAADDMVVSPTYLPDAVHTCLDLLIDGESGVWHLANRGEITWAGLACRIADRARHDARQVVSRSMASLGYMARRPAYSVLGSERGTLLLPLEDAIERFFCDCTDWQTEVLAS